MLLLSVELLGLICSLHIQYPPLLSVKTPERFNLHHSQRKYLRITLKDYTILTQICQVNFEKKLLFSWFLIILTNIQPYLSKIFVIRSQGRRSSAGKHFTGSQGNTAQRSCLRCRVGALLNCLSFPPLYVVEKLILLLKVWRSAVNFLSKSVFSTLFMPFRHTKTNTFSTFGSWINTVFNNVSI